MSKGWVTTARGEALNLDQLITESKRPPGAKDENTEIKKRVIPQARRQLNVRGYKPSGGVTVPEMPEEMKAQMEERKQKQPAAPRKVAYREGGVAESYADLTGVKLKVTKEAVERRDARKAKERNEFPEVKDEALDEIMEDLAPEPEPAPVKASPRRRTTKKKTTAS